MHPPRYQIWKKVKHFRYNTLNMYYIWFPGIFNCITIGKGKIKGKVVPVLNQTPRHGYVWCSADIATRVIKLGARWWWVVSFTLQPLYTRRPVHMRLGLTQIRSRCGDEKENLCSCRESNLVHLSHSSVVLLRELPCRNTFHCWN
jgi:hypothetical protein